MQLEAMKMGNIPKERLQALLTVEQRDALYLEEDEDFIYLYDRRGKPRAVFSAHGATVESIQKEAEKLMCELG